MYRVDLINAIKDGNGHEMKVFEISGLDKAYKDFELFGLIAFDTIGGDTVIVNNINVHSIVKLNNGNADNNSQSR